MALTDCRSTVAPQRTILLVVAIRSSPPGPHPRDRSLHTLDDTMQPAHRLIAVLVLLFG